VESERQTSSVALGRDDVLRIANPRSGQAISPFNVTPASTDRSVSARAATRCGDAAGQKGRRKRPRPENTGHDQQHFLGAARDECSQGEYEPS